MVRIIAKHTYRILILDFVITEKFYCYILLLTKKCILITLLNLKNF